MGLFRVALACVLVHCADASPTCTATVCKEPYGENWARWPKNAPAGAKYPMVSFAHGMLSPVLGNYVKLVDHIVEQGFVVVAPNTCDTAVSGIAGYCPDFGKDVLASIKAALSLKHSSSPPVWAKLIDEDLGVSLAGHSMGAAAVLKVAGGKYGSLPNLTAVVSLHPACQPEDCGLVASIVKKISVASFLAATPYDEFVVPGAVWNYHEHVASSPSAPSIFAELSCKTPVSCDGHAEVNTHLAASDVGGSLWTPHVGAFLSCYVKGKGCNAWPCPPSFPKFGNKLMKYDVKPCTGIIQV